MKFVHVVYGILPLTEKTPLYGAIFGLKIDLIVFANGETVLAAVF